MLIPLDHIIPLLVKYRYAIIFPIAVVEGPIITIIGGFLVSLGKLNLFAVYFFVVLGDVVGDLFYYYIGKRGGIPLIAKYGRYLKITPERVLRLETLFKDHTARTLMIGKFTHAVGTVVLLAAGIAKTDLKKFIVYNLLGTLIKAAILILIGYYFGQAYVKINAYLDYTGYAMAGIAILLAGGYFIFVKVSRKYL